MKRVIPVVLLLLFPFLVFPQQDKEKKQKAKEPRIVFLDVSSGVSFPLGGDYPLADRKQDGSGYAKTGYFIQANCDWMGKKDFGMAFQFTFQDNPLKDQAKTDTLFGSIYPIGSGSWKNFYFMLGPVYLKKLDKFIIDAKILGGLIVAFSPVFSVTNPETKQKEQLTGTGFGVGIGLGGGYYITQKLGIRININYMAAFPRAEKQYNAYVIEIDTAGHFIYSAPVKETIKKTVPTFNAGLGLIYKF